MVRLKKLSIPYRKLKYLREKQSIICRKYIKKTLP